MKGIKEKTICLPKYGVEVKQFLTHAEIQNIINNMKAFGTWSERQTCKDMMILAYVTDVGTETLEEIGHDKLLTSGFIDDVKDCVYNVTDIDMAIEYEESITKSLTTLAKKLPEISDSVKELNKNGGTVSSTK